MIVKKETKEVEDNAYYAKVAIVFWIACYFLSVLFLLLSGKSLAFILTGGLTGNGDLLESRKMLQRKYNKFCFIFILIASYFNLL